VITIELLFDNRRILPRTQTCEICSGTVHLRPSEMHLANLEEPA
jgi:hypothetical protein